ncbi:nuclease-related domain-containing protein [Erythrobacter sp. R86502]|uniref:nuclease-related domain-containing protein n=1 Tax=Erythrobacter sp. R86502 TaxID=3093846 RepID=UPI0036D2F004
MILKASDGRAADIDALEALLTERITVDQRRAIETELYTLRQGARGERETAHILDRTYGHSERVVVIHDLRLPDGLGGHVQFDHLLLNRVLKRIAVLETKNFTGRISKNEHDEWCVWYPKKRHPVEIPNPVAQAERAARLLELWLEAHQHSAAFRRVEGWVIVPPTCKIDRTRIGTGTRIVKVDNFHERWIEDVSWTDTTGFLTGLSVGQLRAVGAQLVSQHVPPYYAWRKRFSVAEMALSETALPTVLTDKPGIVEKLPDTLTEGTTVPQEGQDTIQLEDGATQVEHPDQADEGQTERAENSAADQKDAESTTKRTKSAPKASALIPVVDGISERALPDGRVAFLAQTGTPAADALAAICKGRAIWNPRFRNWLCPEDKATEIREALVKQEAETQS